MRKIYELSLEELLERAESYGLPKIGFSLNRDAVCELMPGGKMLFLTAQEYARSEYGFLKDLGNFEVVHEETEPFSEVNAEVDDDVRLIVAIGGDNVMKGAKRLAYPNKTKLILCPLCEYGQAFVSGKRERRADLICLDGELHGTLSRDNLASAAGELFSKLITFEDYRYRGLVEGEPFEEEYVTAARLSLSRLLSADLTKKEGTDKLIVCVAELFAICAVAGCTCGAETQLSETLSAYAECRQGDRRLRGENLFLSALIVGKLYEGFLNSACGAFSIPPDRGQLAERIRRIFRIPESVTLSMTREYDLEQDVKEYKLSGAKDLLFDGVCGANEVLKAALSYVRRLYTDGGFFLKYYISGKELMRLLSVSTEYFHLRSMLTHIGERGLLEELAG